jgi:hypothetical protein
MKIPQRSKKIAPIPLDFWAFWSVHRVRFEELCPMDAEVIEHMTRFYLAEIRSRLEHAAGVGRAADACVSAGFHEKGIEVALDIEQPLYEVTTLLNAASLINRIARKE